MLSAISRFSLDYGAKASAKLLANLSGLVANGDFLWTVSDEGRSFECLRSTGDEFILDKQFLVDDLVHSFPGAPSPQDPEGAELDLEAIDFYDGHLWLCGSHCNVRKKAKRKDELNAEIRARPSRNFLARIAVESAGASLGQVTVAPFDGPDLSEKRCRVIRI